MLSVFHCITLIFLFGSAGLSQISAQHVAGYLDSDEVAMFDGLESVGASSPVFSYNLKNAAGKDCLLMNASGHFHLTYFNTSNVTVSVPGGVPLTEAKKVSGQCTNGTTEAVLTIDFDDKLGVLQSLSMTFKSVKSQVLMTSFSLTFNQKNGSIFVNPNVTGAQNRSGSPNLMLSSDTRYFLCNSPVYVNFSEPGNNLLFEHLQVQAFGANGTYSPDMDQCDADKTTTATTPTPAPTSTPTVSPIASELNFTIKDDQGNVCELLSLMATFDITYLANLTSGKQQNITKMLPLPNKTKATGECSTNSTSQSIMLKFYSNWHLNLTFVMTNKQYNLANISLSYTLNPSLLPNASFPNRKVSGSSNDPNRYPTPEGQYYVCKNKLAIKLSPQATLTTMNLKLQAFRGQTNSTNFLGNPKECETDMPVDNIVPIVVGAALAGLVVIVIIAYIIGRRRTTAGSGYQSV